MANAILKHKKLFHDYSGQFNSTFNMQLDRFWDMWGFDICAFDSAINCPDGISLKDFLAEQYGKDASELVEKLLA